MITCSSNAAARDSLLQELAPDLTPLLDILFILLVFFMLSARVALQSLDITLPSSVAGSLSPLNQSAHILLEIQEQAYVLDGEKISDFRQLETAISGLTLARPSDEIIIAGDRRISIARLLKVLAYLRSQGIEAANILMEEEAP